MRTMEDPWRTRRRGLALLLQPAPHIAVNRQRARALGLSLPLFQTDQPTVEIHLLPSEPTQLVFPRAGVIAAHDRAFRLAGSSSSSLSYRFTVLEMFTSGG